RVLPRGVGRRDLQGGRDVLPAFLLPAAVHLEGGQEDGVEPGGGEAAARRGRAVHRLDGKAAADRAQRTRGEPHGVMSVVALAVLACATIATGFQVFQVVAAWRFLRRARRFSRGGTLPPVTVLTPLKGPGGEV